MVSFFCGAAGIRTLVQTKHLRAFYMLSFYLGFRYQAGIKADLAINLVSKVLLSGQNTPSS